MKTISSIYLVFIMSFGFGCQGDNKERGLPEANFIKDTFDFKKIIKGTIVNVSFAFKNTGTSDVIIKNTSVGCGCTKVKSIKDTIRPDEITDIGLIYDSKDDSGKVLKTFVIETNTNPKLHVLYIKGTVE